MTTKYTDESRPVAQDKANDTKKKKTGRKKTPDEIRQGAMGRAWREHYGLSREQMARRMSTGASQIGKLESAERRFTSEWMRRWAKALPIPLDYLLSFPDDIADSRKPRAPEGHEVDPLADTLEDFADEAAAEVRADTEEDVVYVPLYDVSASAGHGAFVDDETIVGRFPVPMSMARQLAHDTDSLAVIQVLGDSMEPTLSAADNLLVDTSVRKATRDGVYVLNIGDSVVVKRVTINPADGKLTISSDNTSYRRYSDVPPERVTVLGRAVWIGKSLL